jgi:hypothetical protein
MNRGNKQQGVYQNSRQGLKELGRCKWCGATTTEDRHRFCLNCIRRLVITANEYTVDENKIPCEPHSADMHLFDIQYDRYWYDYTKNLKPCRRCQTSENFNLIEKNQPFCETCGSEKDKCKHCNWLFPSKSHSVKYKNVCRNCTEKRCTTAECENLKVGLHKCQQHYGSCIERTCGEPRLTQSSYCENHRKS